MCEGDHEKQQILQAPPLPHTAELKVTVDCCGYHTANLDQNDVLCWFSLPSGDSLSVWASCQVPNLPCYSRSMHACSFSSPKPGESASLPFSEADRAPGAGGCVLRGIALRGFFSGRGRAPHVFSQGQRLGQWAAPGPEVLLLVYKALQHAPALRRRVALQAGAICDSTLIEAAEE